jgi:hypothetical protein
VKMFNYLRSARAKTDNHASAGQFVHGGEVLCERGGVREYYTIAVPS